MLRVCQNHMLLATHAVHTTLMHYNIPTHAPPHPLPLTRHDHHERLAPVAGDVGRRLHEEFDEAVRLGRRLSTTGRCPSRARIPLCTGPGFIRLHSLHHAVVPAVKVARGHAGSQAIRAAVAFDRSGGRGGAGLLCGQNRGAGVRGGASRGRRVAALESCKCKYAQTHLSPTPRPLRRRPREPGGAGGSPRHPDPAARQDRPKHTHADGEKYRL